ncbi:unnamed protein product, partial [Ectocarpus sp. 8 AP-2014]
KGPVQSPPSLICSYPMSFRSRPLSARDGQTKGRTGTRPARRGSGGYLSRQPGRQSILRPLLAGMASAAAILYVCGWDSTRHAGEKKAPVDATAINSKSVGNAQWTAVVEGRDELGGGGHPWAGKGPEGSFHGGQEPRQTPPGGGGSQADNRPQGREGRAAGAATPSSFLSEGAVKAVVGAVESYADFARRTLEADELAVQQGRPLQGKYIVLDSGNELVNRLRGVMS